MWNKRVRWRGCPDGGCNYELAIQLIVVMVGKQIINNVIEMWLPKFKKLVTSCRQPKRVDPNEKQWERDNKLDNCHTLYDGKL